MEVWDPRTLGMKLAVTHCIVPCQRGLQSSKPRVIRIGYHLGGGMLMLNN